MSCLEFPVCVNDLWFKPSTLTVHSVIRRVPGEPQTLVVRASDGLLYQVKMPASLQGPNELTNQVLGAELARCLGMPVRSWKPIEFSQKLIDSEPLCFPKPGSGLTPPAPGRYLASRALGRDGEERAYEILPGPWLHRVDNRDDFAGMLVLDLWANRLATRKAVFIPSASRFSFTAIFLHDGLMFGGYSGEQEKLPGAALYADLRAYDLPNLRQQCLRWTRKLLAIDEFALRRLESSIPSEWMVPNYIDQTTTMLRARKQKLHHLIDEELTLIAKNR